MAHINILRNISTYVCLYVYMVTSYVTLNLLPQKMRVSSVASFRTKLCEKLGTFCQVVIEDEAFVYDLIHDMNIRYHIFEIQSEF